MQRNYLLDGMRGIAASLVVIYHLGWNQMPQMAPTGHLAVDFFFALSGYVLAGAYENRLRDGASAAKFMAKRLLRFYPLHLLGLALGVANALYGQQPALRSAMFGVAMLPDLLSDKLYPLNGPAWSLFFELIVNVLFAVLLVRMGTRWLAAICVACAVYIMATIDTQYGMNVGWSWASAVPGLARTIYAFTFGMMIWRLRSTPARLTWWALAPAAGLVALLLLPNGPAWRILMELVGALFICPALVFAGTFLDVPRPLRWPMEALGAASFALYAIHQPLIGFAKVIARRVSLPPELINIVVLGALLVASYLLARLYDEPVRKAVGLWLRHRNVRSVGVERPAHLGSTATSGSPPSPAAH